MAKKKSKAMRTGSAQADLQRLTQSQVSFIVGKPTSWVRENSQRFIRDQGSRYHAPQVVAAMLSMQSEQLGPALISDEHFGPLEDFCWYVAMDVTPLTGLVRIFNEIVDQQGEVLGHAAIGKMLHEMLAAYLRANPHKRETEEQIRAESEQRLKTRLAEVEIDEARENCRLLTVCRSHGRYKWGRTWKPLPVPAGYIECNQVVACDKCEEC